MNNEKDNLGVNQNNNNDVSVFDLMDQFSKSSGYDVPPMASVQAVPPVPPVEPMQAVSPVSPVEPMQAVPPVSPVEPMQAVSSVKPVEPMQAVPPVPPVEPMQAVSSVKPVEPMQAVPPVSPVEPMQAVPPVSPVEPMQAVPPVSPVEPMQAVPPVSSVEPMQAVPPVSPVEPMQAVPPVEQIPTINMENNQASDISQFSSESQISNISEKPFFQGFTNQEPLEDFNQNSSFEIEEINNSNLNEKSAVETPTINEENKDNDIEGIQQNIQVPPDLNIQNLQTDEPKKVKKKKSNLIIVIIVLVLFLAIAAVIAVLVYFNFSKTSELVCIKEELKDEFIIYETDIVSFKGNKFANSKFQQEVVFYSDYLDMKSSILEDSKNQFTGTGMTIQTEENENGFVIITNLDKGQFSNFQGIKSSDFTKEKIKKAMTNKGYTCE